MEGVFLYFLIWAHESISRDSQLHCHNMSVSLLLGCSWNDQEICLPYSIASIFVPFSWNVNLFCCFCNPIHCDLVFAQTKQHVLRHIVFLCRSLATCLGIRGTLGRAMCRLSMFLQRNDTGSIFGAIKWPYFNLQLMVTMLKDRSAAKIFRLC